MPNDVRWSLARRLLSDSNLDPSDRVAGSLVLLYAQPVGRISRLTADHVHVDPDGAVRLRLGRTELQLPSPLDALIQQLPAHRPAGIARHLHDQRWLFPGRQPGRPADLLQLHPNTATGRVRAAGGNFTSYPTDRRTRP